MLLESNKDLVDPLASSHRNSLASPFLRLPLEIRRELYRAILGERLVHVRLAMGDIALKPWRHVICQHGHPKHLRAEQHRSLTTARAADDWEPQHRLCKWETYYNPDTKEGSNYWDDERMHLAILRCCRQMYMEANPILWSTNTFSIHDHRTLKEFMAERNATQKAYMRKLRLRLDMKQRYQVHYRRQFLTPELMHSLSALNHLILILEDDFPARLAHMMALTGKSLTEFGGNRIDAGLETLSLLPLRTVDIEVLSPKSPTGEDDLLKEAWKKDYAQGIRDCLLGRLDEIRPGY